jgi:hypothetical protein
MMPKGKTWIHMTDETSVPQTMTPSEFLEFLRESEDIEDVGTEDVRGEQAVHLRGPVDVMELAEKTDSKAAERFSKMPGAQKLEMLIDVWVVEADNRMTRMKATVSHPDQKGAIEVGGDLLEYDVPLDKAQEPDEDEVAEFDELSGG